MAFPYLLDQPAIRQRALRFTVEQYHLLGEANLISEKVELLDGVIVEKMPKSPLHVFTTDEISALLREAIDEGYSVRQEQSITCRNSESEPDIAVVSGTRADYFRFHPSTARLVIEVAISSAGVDFEKATIYAEALVYEYWIVFPEEKRIEVYTAPTGQGYISHRAYVFPDVVSSEILPNFRLNLGTFFPSRCLPAG